MDRGWIEGEKKEDGEKQKRRRNEGPSEGHREEAMEATKGTVRCERGKNDAERADGKR